MTKRVPGLDFYSRFECILGHFMCFLVFEADESWGQSILNALANINRITMESSSKSG